MLLCGALTPASVKAILRYWYRLVPRSAKCVKSGSQVVGNISQSVQTSSYLSIDNALEGGQTDPGSFPYFPVGSRKSGVRVSPNDGGAQIPADELSGHSGWMGEDFRGFGHASKVAIQIAQVWVAVTQRWVYAKRRDRIHISFRDGRASASQRSLECGGRRIWRTQADVGEDCAPGNQRPRRLAYRSSRNIFPGQV